MPLLEPVVGWFTPAMNRRPAQANEEAHNPVGITGLLGLPAAVEQAAVVEIVDQDFRDVAARVNFDPFDTVPLADVP